MQERRPATADRSGGAKTYEFRRLIEEWRVARLGPSSGLQVLRDVFLRHVRRATRRYPDPYFESCEKDQDSVRVLSDELLARCDHQMCLRKPFLGRAPFTAYLQDHTEDAQVLFHTFYGHFSLLRDLLKKTYADNLRMDLRLRAQAEQWTQVGALLPKVAEPTGARVGRNPVWRAKATPPDAPAPGDGLEQRVVSALRAFGAATQAKIVQQLRSSDAHVPAPAEPASDPVNACESHVNRTAVRAAAHRAWSSFEDVERDLMVAAMLGSPLEDFAQRHPELLRGSALTVLFIRLDTRLRAELAKELDIEVPPRASRKDDPAAVLPQELGTLIFDVLQEVVPGWHQRQPTRDGLSPRSPLPYFAPAPALTLVEPLAEEDVNACLAIWDALFHPALAIDLGLADNLLAAIGAAALRADPARALAEAEHDEGLYLDADLVDWDDPDVT